MDNNLMYSLRRSSPKFLQISPLHLGYLKSLIHSSLDSINNIPEQQTQYFIKNLTNSLEALYA